MRYLSLLIAFVFLLFSIVQYNDPDPMVWISIYGIIMLAAILVFLGKLNEIILWILLPLYLSGCIYLWPERFEGVSMPMDSKPWIEEAREALGLLIASVCLVVLIFIHRKTNNRKSTN